MSVKSRDTHALDPLDDGEERGDEHHKREVVG